MGILDFVFGLIVVVAILFIAICIVCMRYNYQELEKENKILKEKLEKIKKRKYKSKGGR